MVSELKYSLRSVDIYDNNTRKERSKNFFTPIRIVLILLLSILLVVLISSIVFINLQQKSKYNSFNNIIKNDYYSYNTDFKLLFENLHKRNDKMKNEISSLKKKLSEVDIGIINQLVNDKGSCERQSKAEIEKIEKSLLEKYEKLQEEVNNIESRNNIEKKLLEFKNEISNISKEVKQMKEKGGVIENFSLTKQAYNEISIMFNELLSIYTSSSKDDESYTKSVPNSILENIHLNIINDNIDYALYALGTRVVYQETSATIPCKSAFQFFFQLFGFLYCNNQPEIVISQSNKIGDCWPMKGDSGNLTLLLSEAINPSKFVIEHKKWSCLLNPFSMPKSISIYGYSNGNEMKLVDYVYDKNKPEIQIIEVETDLIMQKYRLQINDNYGDKEYTCIYRFRILQ